MTPSHRAGPGDAPMSRPASPQPAYSRAVMAKAARIRLVVTDCDGVWTDGGVYYSERGEALKRFQIRDGMGVERLKDLAAVETAILSGECSPSLQRRAEKLAIAECLFGIRDKPAALRELAARRGFGWGAIAYIGNDVNDLEVFGMAGLSAAPSDAMAEVLNRVDVVCRLPGGHGAFRELAELILAAQCG